MSSANTVAAVNNAGNVEEQITRLRQLKNEIIGHEQRKEAVIKTGLVQTLIDIVAKSNQGRGRQEGGVPLLEAPTGIWTPEDEARLQATLILGVIANSGPAFVAPLLAGSAQRVLVSGLDRKTQPRLIAATLQALQNIFVALSDALDMEVIDPPSNRMFFDNKIIDTICDLLPEEPTKSNAKQITLIAGIVRFALREEGDRTLVAKSRILDRFAQYLADYALSQGHVFRQGPLQPHARAPPESIIPSILDATSSIISVSEYRAHRFLLAIAQNHVFVSASSSPGPRILPTPPTQPYKTVSFQGGPQAVAVPSTPSRYTDGPFDSFSGGCGGVANAVCAWLVVLARSFSDAARLAALSLLARVHVHTEHLGQSGAAQPEVAQKLRDRRRKIALYAVPIAVKLVQQMSENGGKVSDNGFLKDAHAEKTNACLVLAQLLATSRDLQTAAVEAGTIKHLCAILKRSFDNIALSKPMWNPKPLGNTAADCPETCKMGDRGLPTEIMRAMQARQGALAAIAAICTSEDLHRKAIVEGGVIPCIIDSLKPLPENMEQKLRTNGGRMSPKDGNTIDTIMAACSAAQSMSRSVSLLRTSLIDAGIAKPLFSLIHHPSGDVKTVATNVCCNLLLDFSPMREDIIAAGAVKVLTEHARTGQPLLRLSSLWALKHLVLAAPKEMKISTLQELGPEWLIGIISDEKPNESSTSHSGSGGVSVADLLNPSSMDVDTDLPSKQNNDTAEDEDGEVMYDETTSHPYQSSSLRSTLKTHPSPYFSLSKFASAVRVIETYESTQASRYLVAIQEQALDFLRNLLNGDSSAEMTDHLLQTLGTDRLFALLISHLNQNSCPTPPPELTLSALHLLNHMAAASPRHRAILTTPQHRNLLQAWLPLFIHPDRNIRVICVWTVINLTWVEDESDRRETRERCRILRELGFVEAVGRLQGDADLDVRERVKTVERQIMGL